VGLTSSQLADVVGVLRGQFLLAAQDLVAGVVTEETPPQTPGYSIVVTVFGNEIALWAPSDMSTVDIAAYVADELQGLVLDDAWGEPRPVCPGHAHPPSAKVDEGAAWWICPASGRRTELIWPAAAPP
jgi:hypothetical protein